MAATAPSSTGTLLNEAELERLQERLSRRSVNQRKGASSVGPGALKISDLRNESPSLLSSSAVSPHRQQQPSGFYPKNSSNSPHGKMEMVNNGFHTVADESQFLVNSNRMADRYSALPSSNHNNGNINNPFGNPIPSPVHNSNQGFSNNYQSARLTQQGGSSQNDDLVLRLQSRISTLEAMLEKSHEKLEYFSSSLQQQQQQYHANATAAGRYSASPALLSTTTPDVYVLQRRIDEQNARIASLEKALKVKESSILHLSMSLENQLDTLHTYVRTLSF